MAIKEYFRPKTLKEASELLGALPESAKILAGGTDLLVPDKQNVSSEIQVISLRDIDELKKGKGDSHGYCPISCHKQIFPCLSQSLKPGWVSFHTKFRDHWRKYL